MASDWWRRWTARILSQIGRPPFSSSCRRTNITHWSTPLGEFLARGEKLSLGSPWRSGSVYLEGLPSAAGEAAGNIGTRASRNSHAAMHAGALAPTGKINKFRVARPVRTTRVVSDCYFKMYHRSVNYTILYVFPVLWVTGVNLLSPFPIALFPLYSPPPSL